MQIIQQYKKQSYFCSNGKNNNFLFITQPNHGMHFCIFYINTMVSYVCFTEDNERISY